MRCMVSKANANNEKPYFRISLCLSAVGIVFILVKCNYESAHIARTQAKEVNWMKPA